MDSDVTQHEIKCEKQKWEYDREQGEELTHVKNISYILLTILKCPVENMRHSSFELVCYISAITPTAYLSIHNFWVMSKVGSVLSLEK